MLEAMGILLVTIVLLGMVWRMRRLMNGSVRVAHTRIIQELTIKIDGRFFPDVVFVRRGWPVRLHFYRDEAGPIDDRLVFEGFGIEKPLPLFAAVSVDVMPTHSGEFVFGLAERPIRGLLIVK